MKKQALLYSGIIFFFLIQSCLIFAQTNVSGGIYSNTTWTLANSPYIVTDTVVVFPGVTLTIQPGVVVKFDNSIRLEIRQAKIMAMGTSVDSITFTSNAANPSAGVWSSIYLNGITPYSQFNYCNFKYANRAINIDNYGVGVNIRNSKFENNIYGLYSYDFSMKCFVDSSSFRNNTTGVYAHEWVFLDHCEISQNQTGANCWGLSKILNCVIDSNTIEGLNISAWNDTIINCQISNNGIGLHDYAMGPAAYITQNIIENNNIGIKLEGWADTITCNKICNSTTYDLYYNVNFNSNAATVNHNYWCTADSISTSPRIYDGYDNINLGLVHFMPLDTVQCYLSGCNLSLQPIASNATCGTCNNGSAIVQVANGFAPYIYTWYSSPIQTSSTATGLLPGTYSVCVTDAHGCSVCDSVYIDSTYCNGLSIITNATNATCSACTDGSAYVNVTGGTAPYNYTWYTSPMQSSDTAVGLGAGTYAVCVSDFYGCTVCDSVTISTGSCSAFFNLFPDTIQHYYLATNMASGVGPLQYIWDWGDNSPFDFTPFPNHTYAAAGFYTICLTITDSVGCSSTHCTSYYLQRVSQNATNSMVFVNVIAPGPSGLIVTDLAQQISAFPNPFHESVQLNLPESARGKSCLVTLTDASGRVVLVQQTSNAKTTIIKRGDLEPGIYFCNLSSDGQSLGNIKLIVQ